MITLKSDREFAKMAIAGACVAAVHEAVRNAAKPGVSLKDLDVIAADVTAERGCIPSFLGYQPAPHQIPYPGHLCLSVNDVIVHGIPSEYRLRAGDVLSVDAGAIFEGFHGDAAFTIAIGEASPEAARLISATEEGMWAGIRQVKAGNRVSDISAAVQAVGERHGAGIVREYVGHGIGRQMHEEPQIPNIGEPGRGIRLRTGMALCIEPMFNLGGWETTVDPDGWTVRTADGSLSAHFEHTVAITKDGVKVMTLGEEPVDLVEITDSGYHYPPVLGTRKT
ncbi:MAG: type I methionyl aminopeptidase [Acidimicrobiia bacterium]